MMKNNSATVGDYFVTLKRCEHMPTSCKIAKRREDEN